MDRQDGTWQGRTVHGTGWHHVTWRKASRDCRFSREGVAALWSSKSSEKLSLGTALRRYP